MADPSSSMVAAVEIRWSKCAENNALRHHLFSLDAIAMLHISSLPLPSLREGVAIHSWLLWFNGFWSGYFFVELSEISFCLSADAIAAMMRLSNSCISFFTSWRIDDILSELVLFPLSSVNSFFWSWDNLAYSLYNIVVFYSCFWTSFCVVVILLIKVGFPLICEKSYTVLNVHDLRRSCFQCIQFCI